MIRYILMLFVVFVMPTAGWSHEMNDYSWENPLLVQFHDLLPQISKSFDTISEETSSIAISDIVFDGDFNESFRRVTTGKIRALLSAQPGLKVVKVCKTCQRVRTYIVGNTLHASRGIGENKFRKQTAEELGVRSFLHIAFFKTEKRLNIIINAYHANSGNTIHSETLTGFIMKNRYVSPYFGILSLKATTTSGNGEKITLKHQATAVGSELLYRLHKHISFSTGAALFFTGDDDEAKEQLDEDFNGALLDGSVLFSMGDKFSAAFLVGAGQIISPSIKSPTFTKYGVRFAINQFFNFGAYSLRMSVSNPEVSNGEFIVVGMQF